MPWDSKVTGRLTVYALIAIVIWVFAVKLDHSLFLRVMLTLVIVMIVAATIGLLIHLYKQDRRGVEWDPMHARNNDDARRWALDHRTEIEMWYREMDSK